MAHFEDTKFRIQRVPVRINYGHGHHITADDELLHHAPIKFVLTGHGSNQGQILGKTVIHMAVGKFFRHYFFFHWNMRGKVSTVPRSSNFGE